jgi:hypothetical protein
MFFSFSRQPFRRRSRRRAHPISIFFRFSSGSAAAHGLFFFWFPALALQLPMVRSLDTQGEAKAKALQSTMTEFLGASIRFVYDKTDISFSDNKAGGTRLAKFCSLAVLRIV